MTEFKVGDRVRVIDSPYDGISTGDIAVITENDGATSYPIAAKFNGVWYRFAVRELELIEPARPTAKEEILNLKAQILSIKSVGDEMGVREASIRAKGIIEGLDAALAFIYEESLSEEDRKALDAIDGGVDPW